MIYFLLYISVAITTTFITISQNQGWQEDESASHNNVVADSSDQPPCYVYMRTSEIIAIVAYLLSIPLFIIVVVWCFKIQANRDARKKAGLPQKKYAPLEVFNSVVSDIAKESAKQTNRKIAAKKSAAKRKKIKW